MTDILTMSGSSGRSEALPVSSVGELVIDSSAEVMSEILTISGSYGRSAALVVYADGDAVAGIINSWSKTMLNRMTATTHHAKHIRHAAAGAGRCF